MFTMGPILTHFDDTYLAKLETDASDFVVGAIVSQLCEDEKWHPVAFHSRKFMPGEINYNVHNKERAAIVEAFKEIAYMLISVADQILVYTDHKNLDNFNTIKTVKRRQHRWAEFLQAFNFKIVYKKGCLNEKTDALSRGMDHHPEERSNCEPFTIFRSGQYIYEEPIFLRPHMLQTCQGFRLQTTFHETLVKQSIIIKPTYQC